LQNSVLVIFEVLVHMHSLHYTLQA
jgi:hypothetical protein